MKLGFSQYINDLRIAEAQRLLRQESIPILEVALQCSFSSKTSFNRAFRTKLGLTPTEWRKLSTFTEVLRGVSVLTKRVQEPGARWLSCPRQGASWEDGTPLELFLEEQEPF